MRFRITCLICMKFIPNDAIQPVFRNYLENTAMSRPNVKNTLIACPYGTHYAEVLFMPANTKVACLRKMKIKSAQCIYLDNKGELQVLHGSRARAAYLLSEIPKLELI